MCKKLFTHYFWDSMIALKCFWPEKCRGNDEEKRQHQRWIFLLLKKQWRIYRMFADQADKLIAFNSIIIKAIPLQLVPIERSI